MAVIVIKLLASNLFQPLRLVVRQMYNFCEALDLRESHVQRLRSSMYAEGMQNNKYDGGVGKLLAEIKLW